MIIEADPCEVLRVLFLHAAPINARSLMLSVRPPVTDWRAAQSRMAALCHKPTSTTRYVSERNGFRAGAIRRLNAAGPHDKLLSQARLAKGRNACFSRLGEVHQGRR